MTEVGGIAGGHLRSLIERIERLQEDRAAINADIREDGAGCGSGLDFGPAGLDERPQLLVSVLRGFEARLELVQAHSHRTVVDPAISAFQGGDRFRWQVDEVRSGPRALLVGGTKRATIDRQHTEAEAAVRVQQC